MRGSEPTTAARQATRRQVRDAYVSLVSAGEPITMISLARQANLSRATLYRTVGDISAVRELVLGEALDQADRLLALYLRPVLDGAAGTSVLDAAVLTLELALDRSRWPYGALLSHDPACGPPVADAIKVLGLRVADAANEAGELLPELPLSLVSSILATTALTLLRATGANTRSNPDDALAVFERVVRSLAPELSTQP